MVKAHVTENALIAEKSAGTRPKCARRKKGICKVVALEKEMGTVLVLVVPKELAFFVEGRGIRNSVLQKNSQEGSWMVESKAH